MQTSGIRGRYTKGSFRSIVLSLINYSSILRSKIQLGDKNLIDKCRRCRDILRLTSIIIKFMVTDNPFYTLTLV